jgi:tight adherence protein B
MATRRSVLGTATRPLAVALAGLVIAVVSLVGSPGAADGLPFEVRAVDATGDKLVVDVVHSGSSLKDVRLNVADKDVTPSTVLTFPAAGVPISVMAVLDNSTRVGNGPLQISKQAVLDSMSPGESPVSSLGVVTTGGLARSVVGQSTSPAQVRGGIESVEPMGNPALWDGLVLAASGFGTQVGGSRDIVLITGGTDSGSTATFSDAIRAVKDAGAAVHVINMGGATPVMASLASVVAESGGTIQNGTSNDLSAMLGNVSKRLGSQWRITASVPPQSADNLVPLTVNWGDDAVDVSYEPGAISIGADNLRPISGNSILESILSTSILKFLIVVLACASAGMIVYSLASLVVRGNDRLDFALRHYDPSQDEVEEVDDEGSLAKGVFLKRVVAMTEDIAQRQGMLVRVESLLERADLPLRPAEALFFYISIVIVAALLGALLFGNLMIVGVVILIALIAPRYIVQFRANKRRKTFLGQLPDMLSLLAGTLRAGYSISQGFEAVSQEVDGPMGRELSRIMAEARLGRPLETALDASVVRVQSEDFGWAVMAIRIQREVGGNLAELLLTVADTMTQRERLRREVAGLTAEGRISAIVLGVLPPGLGLIMYFVNRPYISKLFTEPIGNVMLGVAFVAMIAGFAWMKKIITIKI